MKKINECLHLLGEKEKKISKGEKSNLICKKENE